MSDIESGSKPTYHTVPSSAPLQPVAEEDVPAPPPKVKVPLKVWLTLLISCCGVFLASVSTSALIIAFPVILADLEMSLDTLIWVLLVVMLMICSMAGSAGKLGDVFGQAALYKFGYALFVAGCVGGGFAQKGHKGYDMLAARVVIGTGAAFLFTNSSAILTNAFAPFGLVGLSQGFFMLASSAGMVLGPVIGGSFAESNWRWIFWYNGPIGGPLVLFAFWAVQEKEGAVFKTFEEFRKTFDWVGAIMYPCGLALLTVALVQIVSPTYPLDQTGPVVAFVVCGAFCNIVSIVDQFYVKDPLFPPEMFNSRIFSLNVISGSLMSFTRGSITYIMILFLQGPYGMNPQQAGIELIPFGIGVMVSGLSSGVLSDKLGIRQMTVVGPLITVAALAGMTTFQPDTPSSRIGGLLFLSGFGIGCFNSPNAMTRMLSAKPHQRGAAAAIGMVAMMVMMMIGICITFSLVLNSVTSAELFDLFIYGSTSMAPSVLQSVINALNINIYIVIAACLLASGLSMYNDFKSAVEPPVIAAAVKAEEEADTADGSEEEKKEVELAAVPRAVDIESQQQLSVAGNNVHNAKI